MAGKYQMEKETLLIVSGMLAVAGIGAWLFKCRSLCPGIIDDMAAGKNTSKYQTLREVFDWCSCAACVEHAQNKLPSIVLAQPENALDNILALQEAAKRAGVPEKAIV